MRRREPQPRGPTAGGTLITLALDAAVHPALLNSTSCRIGGSGDGLPFVHSRPVLAQLSPTTQIADAKPEYEHRAGRISIYVPRANGPPKCVAERTEKDGWTINAEALKAVSDVEPAVLLEAAAKAA